MIGQLYVLSIVSFIFFILYLVILLPFIILMEGIKGGISRTKILLNNMSNWFIDAMV